MDLAQIKEKVADGWLHFRVIVEFLGAPEVFVEKTMNDRLEEIRKEKEMIVASEKVSKIERRDLSSDDKTQLKEAWAGFLELNLLVKHPGILTYFCFNYMPSLIELIEPAKLTFKGYESSEFFNDLQSRLHEINAITKQMNSEIVFLRQNMFSLLRNLVKVLLSSKPLALEDLSKFTGVAKDTLGDFLDTLVDKKEIVMVEDGYGLPKL